MKFLRLTMLVPLGLALVLSVFEVEAESHRTGWVWSYPMLIRRIAEAPVPLSNRRPVIDRDLVICNGEGRRIRVRGTRGWKHFTCTQTLFQRGVDRDLTFRVHVRGKNRFHITNARYGPD